jgi:hypothetical protein
VLRGQIIGDALHSTEAGWVRHVHLQKLNPGYVKWEEMDPLRLLVGGCMSTNRNSSAFVFPVSC